MRTHSLTNYQLVVDLNKHVRSTGIDAVPNKNLAIEIYSGKGVLTSLYTEKFNEVITNDIDKTLDAQYHMKADKFIKEVVFQQEKIDLLDYDAWGCPSFELILFFENIKQHLPIVINYTDGLGMWLKRIKNEKTIRKSLLDRYFISVDEELSLHRIWDIHPNLVERLFEGLARQYNVNYRRLFATQTPNKNYTLASYVIFN